jgi:outer membrane translocation and assembly module TamA
VVRVDSVFIDDNGEIQTARARMEALGGLGKLAGNIEMRLPFPGLGPAWSSALFFDFGQVYQGPPNIGDLRYGVGAGMRYETLVGFIRLDVGFKLNPSLTDLNSAEDIYLYRNGLKYDSASDLPNSFMKRIAIHFSIGQAF